MIFCILILCLKISLVAPSVIPDDFDGTRIRTINNAWPFYNTFYPITSTFINFSIHAGHDAWVALLPVPYHGGRKYEIWLGGDDNKDVKILKNRTTELVKKKLSVLSSDASRGFWIKFWSQNILNIWVGREGEDEPFMSALDTENVISLSYFALATTGDDDYGTWYLKGIDVDKRYIKDLNKTVLTTKSSQENGNAFEMYFNMTDNVLQFFVKASHGASLVFTSGNKYPSYRIQFLTTNVYIIKNDFLAVDEIHTCLEANTYFGYWISFNKTLGQNSEHPEIVILVGRLGETKHLVKYIDNFDPLIDIKYFSVSSNSDIPGNVAEWELFF